MLDAKLPRHREPDESPVEVSVVMPCLNEEATVGRCVRKAVEALQQHGWQGEVVVCDNGSVDRSVAIAEAEGARVVHEVERGYGAAYQRAFASARGRYLVMGDSDDTYDFSELQRFLEPLEQGHDFVNGTRLRGCILPGAMPWLHRYVGNPVISAFINVLFRTGFSDSYCGLRAMTRDAYERIRPASTGMEFALEMVINAGKAGLRKTEVPITYYPRQGASKLRTFHDGWRSLRFMLLYSPTHLFLLPALLLLALGLPQLLLFLPGPIAVGGVTFSGIGSMLVGSMLLILGFQVLSLAILARTFSLAERFDRDDRLVHLFYRHVNLERGLLLGALLAAAGVGSVGFVVWDWIASGFAPIRQERMAIFGLTMTVLGTQTIFTAFFGSLLGLKRRHIVAETVRAEDARRELAAAGAAR